MQKENTTDRKIARRIDRRVRATVKSLVTSASKVGQIEKLLSKPKGRKTVIYALRALLIELSNQSKVGVDSPGVAGAFYRVAALEAEESPPARRWDRIHLQQIFRHLNLLLSKQDFETANALIQYWDDPRSKDLKTDPFPAKRKPKAKKR